MTKGVQFIGLYKIMLLIVSLLCAFDDKLLKIIILFFLF